MDRLNPDDSRPPYQQVAESMRAAIAAGQFEPGAKAAGPTQAVADQFGVSIGTIKRAFATAAGGRRDRHSPGPGVFCAQPGDDERGDGAYCTDLRDIRQAFDGLSARVAALEQRMTPDEA